MRCDAMQRATGGRSLSGLDGRRRAKAAAEERNETKRKRALGPVQTRPRDRVRRTGTSRTSAESFWTTAWVSYTSSWDWYCCVCGTKTRFDPGGREGDVSDDLSIDRSIEEKLGTRRTTRELAPRGRRRRRARDARTSCSNPISGLTSNSSSSSSSSTRFTVVGAAGAARAARALARPPRPPPASTSDSRRSLFAGALSRFATFARDARAPSSTSSGSSCVAALLLRFSRWVMTDPCASCGAARETPTRADLSATTGLEPD